MHRRDLVPGDVIRLGAGDLVPADARLLEAKHLHVNQASLTGESLPTEKEAVAIEPTTQEPLEDRGMVFLGTSVISGSAIALVIATGQATAFGDIAARLAARPPETEFERGTRAFGLLIMKTVFFLVAFVFLASAALRHDPFESLLFAIALAVGLTPEFLPMITTVTLGQGAVHMARQKVIVKHLEAIQNFGSMDVLCSDKTGTLTSGDTVLDLHVDPFGNAAERLFLLAYINSFFETGVESSLNKAVLQKAGASPLDLAIVKHDHPDIAHYQKLDEVPFDFERRRLSIIVKAGEDRLLAKGAPESVLAVCSEYELDGRTFPLDKDVQARYKGTYEALCTDGFRVLAVAYRKMPHQNRYSTADEHDLVLSGYLTFFDPPLEDAADILESLRRDGVAVKILTGDNELVARHICSRVGLDAGRIVVMRQYPRLG